VSNFNISPIFLAKITLRLLLLLHLPLQCSLLIPLFHPIKRPQKWKIQQQIQVNRVPTIVIVASASSRRLWTDILEIKGWHEAHETGQKLNNLQLRDILFPPDTDFEGDQSVVIIHDDVHKTVEQQSNVLQTLTRLQPRPRHRNHKRMMIDLETKMRHIWSPQNHKQCIKKFEVFGDVEDVRPEIHSALPSQHFILAEHPPNSQSTVKALVVVIVKSVLRDNSSLVHLD